MANTTIAVSAQDPPVATTRWWTTTSYSPPGAERPVVLGIETARGTAMATMASRVRQCRRYSPNAVPRISVGRIGRGAPAAVGCVWSSCI